MRVGELFAGIGGFGLAAECVWGRGCIVWANDHEPFVSACYRALFPGVRHIEGDVRDLSGPLAAERRAVNLEPVDLISGGFPSCDVPGLKQREPEGERAGW